MIKHTDHGNEVFLLHLKLVPASNLVPKDPSLNFPDLPRTGSSLGCAPGCDAGGYEFDRTNTQGL